MSNRCGPTVLVRVEGAENDFVRRFVGVVRELVAAARAEPGADDRTGATGRRPEGPEDCP